MGIGSIKYLSIISLYFSLANAQSLPPLQSRSFNSANLVITQASITTLTHFKKSDFTQQDKDTLKSIFYKRPPHLDEFIKLIGYVGIPELQSDLFSLTQPANPKDIRWASLLALARMGDQTATSSIMTRVKKLPVNDDVVYEIFPDLIYTRQREAVDYVVQALQSDDNNCTSADNDHPEAIPCGYRIMELLPSAIKNYPLKLEASGDIKTKDYKKALSMVRDWFRKKGAAYEIDSSTY